MKFGTIENERGEQIELGHATFSQLLICPDRSVRAKAFSQYYEEMEAHENTLAATLKGSIDKDVYYARARGYDSALAQALYPDNVPQTVYDQLIDAVTEHLPVVHEYYDMRRRKMGLEAIHFYDTYVPILSDLETNRTWDEATELIMNALRPLGDEYCSVARIVARARQSKRQLAHFSTRDKEVAERATLVHSQQAAGLYWPARRRGEHVDLRGIQRSVCLSRARQKRGRAGGRTPFGF